jgi:hypothetical protein
MYHARPTRRRVPRKRRHPKAPGGSRRQSDESSVNRTPARFTDGAYYAETARSGLPHRPARRATPVLG